MSTDTPSPVSDGQPSRTSRAPIARNLGRRFYQADSYGLVLLLIVITYAIAASVTTSTGSSVVLVLQVATVWFALRTSKARRGVRLFADGVLVIAVAIAVVAPLATSGNETSLLVPICSALLYLIAPLSIVRDLALRPKVDTETFLGALGAYLLFGMFFAFIYRIMAELQAPTPFFGSAGTGTGSETLFFSFTTLTTTGYGNYVPSEPMGQTFAVLEMLIGQIFLATAIAKVITSWTPTRARLRREEEADAATDDG